LFKILITDLDEVKQRLRMEWAKLDDSFIHSFIHSFIKELI